MTARGFTLVELLAVVMVIGVMAAVVMPATGTMDRGRLLHAADATARAIETARGHASASGRPTGVRAELPEHTVRLVQLRPGAIGPVAVIDAMGSAMEDLNLVTRYGAEIESLSSEEPLADTLWFDHAGQPELRERDGALLGVMRRDAELVLQARGERRAVVLRAISGLVEVEAR